jgi:broad specificity phosphatase PhoE
VTTVLLVRHGRTSANGAGVLAGWTEGVSLDDLGREQVTALAARLSGVRDTLPPHAAAKTTPTPMPTESQLETRIVMPPPT